MTDVICSFLLLTAYYYGQTPAWQQQQWARPYAPQPSAPPSAAPSLSASSNKPPPSQQSSGPYGHFSSGYDESNTSLGGYNSSSASQLGGSQAGGLSSSQAHQYGGIHSFLGGSSPQPQAQQVSWRISFQASSISMSAN